MTRRRFRVLKHILSGLGLAAALAVMAGCSSAPKPIQEAAVFYPALPDLPRVQFLVSYVGAKDIEPEKSGFESFVTGEKESARRLDKPYGVAIHGGKIYVCDTNATVMVFDLNKKTFEPLKGAKGLGKLIQPINISIDKEGNKFVTDPIRGQIVVFDVNDNYAGTIGKSGGWKPVDAEVFEDRVYVADIENSEIKVFDKKTGELLKALGKKGKPAEMLDRPLNLAFDKDGYLYVTDAGKFQVVKFDRDGHFIDTIGKLGTNVGHFARPRGIDTDREGKIYVVDAAFYNVQIFNKEGQNLTFFGEGGTKPGKLILPAQVFIDYDNLKYFEKYVDPNFEAENLVIVTSQFGDRMVNVFAYGKEKGRKYPTNEELLEQLKTRLLKQFKQEAPKEPEKPEGEAPAKTEGEQGK